MRLLFTILLCLLLTGCSQQVLNGTSEKETTTPETSITSNIIASEIDGDVVKYKYYKDEVIDEKGEDVKMRTANSKFFPNGDKTTVKVYAGDQFYKTNDKWYQIQYATTTKAEFDSMTKVSWFKKLFGNTAFADTVYSGGGDGYVYKDNSTDWSDTYNAATGSNNNEAATTAWALASHSLIGGLYKVYRLFLPFNTSAIPSDAIINSAELHINITEVDDFNDDEYAFIFVVDTYQSSTSALANDDYKNCGSDNGTYGRANYVPVFGDDGKLLSDLSVGATTMTLRSDRLDWIKKSGETSTCGGTTGYTCLGIREGHDIFGSMTEPGLSDGIIISTSEDTTASNRPYLEITYTSINQMTGTLLFE